LFIRPELMRKELNASERARLSNIISKGIHWPKQRVIEKIRSDRGFVWVKRQLSQTEESFLRSHKILEFGDSVGLVEETRRFYPNKELAAHVLGSVGIDGQGLEGLELLYDAILSGEQSKIDSSRDARGRRIFRGENGLFAFKDGQSLVLSIDRTIQFDAEKALDQAVREFGAKAGTAIVAEVETGEILALANAPTFNPNVANQYSADSRRNRAITDAYEPGSTFKPLIAGLALENGKTTRSKIYCEMGSFKVADRVISEAETHEQWGWLTLGEVIQHSSNIGAAKIALELGVDSITGFFDKLGVGKKTGLDLPGEAPGRYSSSEARSSVRLANVGFGQGFTTTSLQMLSFYLSIANNGQWIQPRIVKAILNEDPESIVRGTLRWKLDHRFENSKSKKIFEPKTAKDITRMLELVVNENGTGKLAQLEDWPVAGKTGTAQKIDQETYRYSRSKYISSFVGFAPAKNPKLVTLVMLDEPTKKYYASETAAPVFREIMQAALIRTQVPPVDSKVRLMKLANQSSIDAIEESTEATAPRGGSESLASGVAKSPDVKLKRNDKNEIVLPDLRGLSIREAVRAIGTEPVKLEIHGSGIVREHFPKPHETLEPGGRLRLVCSSHERKKSRDLFPE
ncbi:MAG TPA: penicillin-binding transpeptidase domain-containing protein, partial [Oligoflexia bacterium]|nr:penicillin-binding transpeptidase domain-containing protein [Oligoflexia bacterium]